MASRAPREDMPESLAAQIPRDPWAPALGIEFLEFRRGYCLVALALPPHRRNYPGYPHGGVILSRADVALGAACNSHGETSVALTMPLGFLAAVTPGSRLIAEGRERRQARRAGFYDITVSTEAGVAVAAVHCVAHRVDVAPR